jgi:hypothetical protein
MNSETALKLAKDAFTSSTSWIDTNLRADWDLNERQFQGRHQNGSKYLSDAYKFRSKLFRNKTRATIQSNEADAAFAFFSTNRMVNIQAVNDADPVQRASADVMNQLLHYRLRESIPWFKVVMGAWQDSLKHGVACAYSEWKYRQRVTDVSATMLDPQYGYPIEVMTQDVEVLEDRPMVELIPVENLRVDAASDWTDPVNSSPFLIQMVPMFILDVQAKMAETDDKTGAPKWKPLTKEEIQSASKASLDMVRKERNQNREDPMETKHAENSFDVVWVHRNFIRHGDEDWVFYTMGDEHLLTEPVPARTLYKHLRPRERPFVFGNCTVEAHLAYATGVVQVLRDAQRELNDVVNLRMDAFKQNVAGRYLVRRNANVDYDSLRRNIPGSGTLVDDPSRDVLPLQQKDVGASGYQEEDRLALSFDDLSGAFAPSSVASNRKLNETVGGMNLMSSAASKVADYRILIFAKTFVEPLIGQLIRLEQMYETDEVVLSLAAQKAKLAPKYGMNQVTDSLLQQELVITANVGISSTNPANRMSMFKEAMMTVSGMSQDPNIKMQEVIPEVFGILGYQDGMRFFNNSEGGEDPRLAQQQQQIQQLQKMIETKAVEEQGRNARMQELQDKKDRSSLTKELMNMRKEFALKEMDMEHDHAMTTHETMSQSMLQEQAGADGD